MRRLLVALLLVAGAHLPGRAQEAASSDASEGKNPVSFDWGGYLKARAARSWPGQGTVLQPEGDESFNDHGLTGRLNTQVAFGQHLDLALDYEAGMLEGGTWRAERRWDTAQPGLFRQAVLPDVPPQDSRRFFNLTRWVVDEDGKVAYHRLDRLALTLRQDWGVVRLGRQALSWGNGQIFNPMDLFNPFSPLDVEREYKVGDDMAFSQVSLGGSGDIQALCAPRRDPVTGHLLWDQASVAGKAHLKLGATEWDVMAARHYRDQVLGMGSSGSFGPGVWRLDATWTRSRQDAGTISYFSVVANADTSWTWAGRNCYGLVECFFNGLGGSDCSVQGTRPEVRERMLRGDLFTLGRMYLSGQVKVELHPLCSLSLTAIGNVDGPSEILIPRLVWEVSQGLRLTLGGNLFQGSRGREFGGFLDTGSQLMQKYPDKGFVWVGYYF